MSSSGILRPIFCTELQEMGQLKRNEERQRSKQSSRKHNLQGMTKILKTLFAIFLWHNTLGKTKTHTPCVYHAFSVKKWFYLGLINLFTLRNKNQINDHSVKSKLYMLFIIRVSAQRKTTLNTFHESHYCAKATCHQTSIFLQSATFWCHRTRLCGHMSWHWRVSADAESCSIRFCALLLSCYVICRS